MILGIQTEIQQGCSAPRIQSQDNITALKITNANS